MTAMAAPDLSAIERRIEAMPWFAAARCPLTTEDYDEAIRYIDALGLDETHGIEWVESWEKAKAIASDPGWDREWWNIEDDLRKSLETEAGVRHGRETARKAISSLAERTGARPEAAAKRALARAGPPDPALAKAAAGAAGQACVQYGLVSLAGENEHHAFAAKFSIFAHGRWPLCVIDRRFYIL